MRQGQVCVMMMVAEYGKRSARAVARRGLGCVSRLMKARDGYE